MTRVLIASFLVLASLSPVANAQLVPPTKGTNYWWPNTTMARSNTLSFLSVGAEPESGTYVSHQVRQEIQILRQYGMESVRVSGSMYGWLADRVDYVNNLIDFATICKQEGMAITFVLWSSTNIIQPIESIFGTIANCATAPLSSPTDPVLRTCMANYWMLWNLYPPTGIAHVTVANQMGEPYQAMFHDEPGYQLFLNHATHLSWPNQLGAKAMDYVTAVAGAFQVVPGAAVTYDLFNEPDAIHPNGGPVFQLHQPVTNFIKATYDRLALSYGACSTCTGYTVGLASTANMASNLAALSTAGVNLTYESFHAYGTLSEVSDKIAEASVASTGLPLVCSEFYDRRDPGVTGNLDLLIGKLVTAGIPGQVWGVLASNLIVDLGSGWVYLDGIRRPLSSDGTFTGNIVLTGFPAMGTSEYQDEQAILNW
ncbi:MAG: hypothetical protein H6834_12060 [Planctomycetes bacterium]|nr:hypothetical protein [Planctomycetota bacterium]